ncbi:MULTISPECIES: LysR family transcriptional regulator [Flavobacterium]|jgi:DNA-binding transcriptional LysR family regulator|uniref:DNA-binding transcriptional LysR family regulator n=1 Tax=Flavobacterium lindanitolerans TaxID=428988 RepID=A0A497VF20_9FLAO|nr:MULTISPECIES: LysR family transcriptional regulator [Flavobacterium]PZO30873.1 MAG: LysR family transcriptional regulator [Flavobacteriaceae bacterium]PZQ90938.1 MAG: LysR family transcriptional regulator [Flavobacterium johnsoniae]KQS50073.1 LysR family transcriptional regulator [Flavobacterium sp. Leaf359]MBL7866830.1 LysR family transcriptional regulator [Flavobacterium lindanitolerans]MDQ7959628.1 LysR family transcriptional regulator [Flavobacterium lindanitolerans]
MVNLEWYRTFKAVYKSGTLTGAAEVLFISQPGVSLHLSSLENYVGYKLFDRTGRKMVPTERGKVLYNFIIEALTKLEEAEKNFQRSTEKHTPTISVGMCFETFQITLEQYIATLPFNVIIQFGEYPEMVENLEKGILDIIITPQMVPKSGIDYQPFSSETIVLVGGNETDVQTFQALEEAGDFEAVELWLKQQKWYGTTGDMEHLRRFWQLNFNKYPDFRPNYIVPNLNSIVRCLSSGQGLAVIPDFLCKKDIDSGQIKMIWEGKVPLKNTLHFATRKKTIYADEIALIKEIFMKVMK